MSDFSRKVLLTGHDGYIGAVLSDFLAEKNYEVTGLDTFFYEDCYLGSASAPKFNTIRKDLREITEQDLRGFDAVIHLAGLSNDPLGQLSSELTLDLNFSGTVNLAKMAKQANVPRFLYASSCSLYGKSNNDAIDESGKLEPLTAYAKSKALSENALSNLAEDGFTPIILRCATVFGASPKHRVDLVVNNLVAWGMTTGKISIQSDGTPWRPLIHVRDLSRVYEFFLRAPLSDKFSAYNIGFNAQNYQVRHIAESVRECLSGTQIEFSSKPDLDSRSYRVNFDKFLNFSGLQPQWDLTKGIKELVEFYQDDFSMEDFSSRKYTRLKQINYLLETGQINEKLYWSKN